MTTLEITTKDGTELVEAFGWTLHADGRLVVDNDKREIIREYGKGEWSYRQLDKREAMAVSLQAENERLTAALRSIADGNVSGSFGPNSVFASRILEGKSLEEAYTAGVTLTRGM